jgi:hypothetical protein
VRCPPNWLSLELHGANGRPAGVGAAYQFTHDATSNLRQKDDCYSEAIAGFAGGAAVGVASMSLPSTASD